MNKCSLTLSIAIIFILSLLLPSTTKASHAAGGELIYEWVSDSTYRFYFKFYRDCSGSIESSTQTLTYTNTCTNQNYNATMTKIALLPGGVTNGSPVSPGCPAFPTKCLSSTSIIPGYREWWYSVQITLPARCSMWRFSTNVSVRNPSMNLSGTPLFYVEATLNNLVAQGNSSPFFSVKPVPYVCINESYSYNNGGVDPNGDSLVFSNIIPLQGLSTNCVFQTKTPALNVTTNPFQTSNSFTISATTGQIGFTPTEQGAQTITVLVREYRAGVLIGSVMRDVQIQVLACTSTVMTATPKTVTFVNAQSTGGQIRACAGKAFGFCFDVSTPDTSKRLVVIDNHTVSAPGSTVIYNTQYDDSLRGCFSWIPALSDTGLKVFTVSVKDSTCTPPGIIFTQTFVIPIYITPSVKGYKDTTICRGDTAQLTAIGGTTFLWSVVSGTPNSLSCTSCTSPRAYPTSTTRYRVYSNIPSACFEDTVTITIANDATVTASSNSIVCPGDTLKLYASNVSVATGYSWTGPNGFTSSLQNPVIPNAQAINAGRYYARFHVNTCISDTAGTTVLVNIPPTPIASSNSPFCLNDTIKLTASTVPTATSYSWTGPNSFTSTLQNPIITGLSTASAGVYTVHAFRNTCSSLPDSTTVTITVIAAPTTSPLTLCQSIAAAPLTAIGSNLKWYTTATGGIGVTSMTPSTSTPGTTKYYVSQTINGCEGYRDSLAVTILAKPSTPLVTNVSYCLNETGIPSLTAIGTNLKWYTTATGGTGSIIAPTPSSATAGTFNFYVTQTDSNGCESDRATLAVTIKPLPIAPPVTTPVNYCQFTVPSPPITTLVGGVNILWYAYPTGGIGNPTAPTINTNTTSSTTYYVSQTVNGCEGPRSAISAVVNAKPPKPGVTNISYCQNEVAVPLTATGATLTWYTSASGGSGSSTAPTPSTSTPGTYTFYVSNKILGCESDIDSIIVTVKPQPAPPFAGQVNYCQFETPGPITTVAGSNLLWYAAATGGTGSSTAPTPSTTVPGTTFYYVSQTVNGCESNRAQVSVIVKPKPAPPTVSTPVLYCINVTASPLTAGGTNLKWYSALTGGFGSPNPTIPATDNVGTISYYVSQTVDACESDRAKIDVIVDTLTDVNILLSKSPVCQYDSIDISYQGGVPTTGTFLWSFNGGEILSGNGSGPYKIKWDTAGQKTILLYANKDGCRGRDTQKIDVLPAPLAKFKLPAEICRDKELEVRPDANLYKAQSYIWNSDGETISGSKSNIYIVKWPTPGIKSITLYSVSADGCLSLPNTTSTFVREDPDAQISFVSDNEVCKGDTISLKAKEVYSYKYQWSPLENYLYGSTSIEVSAVVYNGIMVLTATDTVGCSANDTAYINAKPCCDLALPSAFTPNGDNKNDLFRPITVGHQQILSFIIVNRYGQVVYSSQDQQQGWDGKFKGEIQDLGTYFYYLKYKCSDNNTYEKKGDVTLVK